MSETTEVRNRWNEWKKLGDTIHRKRLPWLEKNDETHQLYASRHAETMQAMRTWTDAGDELSAWLGCSVKRLFDLWETV